MINGLIKEFSNFLRSDAQKQDSDDIAAVRREIERVNTRLPEEFRISYEEFRTACVILEAAGCKVAFDALCLTYGVRPKGV